MSGLGKTKTSRSVVRAEMPMPDDIDGILQAVRSILIKGDVTQIIVTDGLPISYERTVDLAAQEPDELQQDISELKPMDVVRNIRMEEFDAAAQGLTKASPQTILFWMVFMLECEGWVPTHLIIAQQSNVWSWLGVPARAARRLDKILNLRIERDETLPSDVFLLGGSKHNGATLAEVGFALKGNVRRTP